MRVLVGTTLFHPGAGGKENYLDQLVRGLLERGHEVRIFARFADPAEYARSRLKFEREPRFDSRSVARPLSAAGPTRGIRALLGPLAVRPRGRRLAARLAAAVYAPGLAASARWSEVVHWDGIGFELLGWAFLAAARRAGRPLVVVPHLHAGRWGDGEVDLALYRRAGAVVAKTGAEREVLVKGGVPAGRVHVIGNGPVLEAAADPEAFRRGRGLARPFVLFLGRRSEEKGFGVYCRAASLVRAVRPGVDFAAAGPGEVGEAGRSAGVVDLGFLGERDKASALAACELLCVPSAVEAFGMVYLEAWASGKPVVAGDSSQVASLVEDGADGFAVQPEPDVVALAVQRLLDDPALGRAMGERGRRKVAERYRWETVVEATIETYREAAGR